MINITINAGNISANLQNFSANDLPNLIANGLEKVGSLITTESQSICPVDTGRLRDSMRYQTDADSVVIGTDVEYAPYVHEGTYKMEARPYLETATYSNLQAILDCFK